MCALRDSPGDISPARQALRDSYTNLKSLADFCEKNYLEAPDKRRALQETMSLVTHTLSSVACQVREAAWEVACVLEEQSQTLYREGSRLSFISQVVDIHMEKASRLKIGKLTFPRRPHQAQKILTNEIQGQRTQYTRNPIHFTSLDHIGRGITDSASQFSRTGTMSRKASVKSLTQTQGTLGRNSRIKDPVSPPIIPEVPQLPSPASPPILKALYVPLHPFDDAFCNLLPPPPPAPPTFSLPPLSAGEEHSGFASDFPPYPSPLELGDLLPPPPPPPPDNDINGTTWSHNPIQEDPDFPASPSLQKLGDHLLPPPGYEINDVTWTPDEASNFPECPSPWDCLPPPPDF